MKSRSTPPLTARGSPIRSKSRLVSHPSPVKPRPPCSAGTVASAPASLLGKTGYAFLSSEAVDGAPPEAVAAGSAVSELDPPPHASGKTATRIIMSDRDRTRITLSLLKRNDARYRHSIGIAGLF